MFVTDGERKSYGDKPSYGGKRSFGDKRSFGEDREGGERKSYGDKPAYGDRKSYGDKPAYGDRKSYGDKPAYGDRKSYGDKPAYGERKSYGDKPAYERKPYERKKYVAEITNTTNYPREYNKRDMVQFKLEEKPLDELQTLAQERGFPVGAMVREWVLERLQQELTGTRPAKPAPRPSDTFESEEEDAEEAGATTSFEARLASLERRVKDLEGEEAVDEQVEG